VGTSQAELLTRTNALLDDTAAYERMARAQNPYGDGAAAKRIIAALLGSRSQFEL
jgi:UDP-N-acetylglucosamine 2-epimerase (non-hydrolysing)